MSTLATPRGIATVARLELRQRRRTSRWPVVLGVWFAVLAVVTGLAAYGLRDGDAETGRLLYDIVVFFVLLLGLLVVPSLTATSVNGDREHGVLASLQTTLLRPGDIVLGKLAASWVVAGVFLLVASPFLVWAWVAGGVGLGRALACLAVLALVLLAVCSIGLAFSTLTARPVTSVVLTYLTVAALVVGTVIAVVATLPLVISRGPATVLEPAPTGSGCVAVRHTDEQRAHTERTWWLLAPNPFVIVADAAPSRSTGDVYGTPLSAISGGVRVLRAGATEPLDQCGAPGWPDTVRRSGPVWPWGLGELAVVCAGALAVAVRRVATPMTRLPRGTRVA